MKLLKTINDKAIQQTALEEDAAGGAVGAGAVAACAMPLFSSLVKRSAPKITVIKWKSQQKPKPKKVLGLKEAFDRLYEKDSGGMSLNMDGSPNKASGIEGSFDPASVVAKLKGLENEQKQDRRDTVSFGLEDDNGGLVRVTVKSEQAEDFEKALQSFLADEQRENDSMPEIAEVLFKLKDRYDIVDVQWPSVPEDEEEDQQVQDPQGGQGDPNADPSADPNADPNADPSADPNAAGADMSGGGDESDVKNLLTQVIDMMKADAEARKAEARAREAEAKNKEASAISQQTMDKVKQEEQFLDMETYNKARKEEEREAKRLAQLARWKHDMKKNDGVSDEDDLGDDFDLPSSSEQAPPSVPAPSNAGAEEEETRNTKPKKTIRGRLHPHDIASFILSRVK